MIGQLQKIFRNHRNSTAIGAVFLASICFTPHIAQATDISGEKITASTSMPIWNGFTVEQIADGDIPGAGGENGFTTNAKTGTITLAFDQPYNIDGFKLWNDVVVRAEGIKTFRLDFKDSNATTLSSQVFETVPREVEVQTFTFPKIIGITSVDLVVLSSLNESANPALSLLPSFLERIEVREVAFTGQASRTDSKPDENPNAITLMEEYIDGLQDIIKGHESDIRDLQADLAKETKRADTTFALLQERDATIATLLKGATATATLQLLEEKDGEISDLKAQLENQPHKPTSPLLLLLGAAGFLGLGGLAGSLLGRRRTAPRPPQAAKISVTRPHAKQNIPPTLPESRPKREEGNSLDSLKKGMVFSASPMMLGGLPPALAVIKPVYDAVGRIGFAQQGKPTGKDEAFGTGILISDTHVLTNRHVWEMFEHRLASDEGTGIEFYGEKKSDKSEFIEFNGAPPICIEGWDAAIFTLKRAPEHRKPVSITSRPAKDLNDIDIVVVGYPQAHRVTEDIDEVTEKDPIFGVKRYSEGKIFRHSADIENPYGVEAAVESIINPAETMQAVCHNASTLGGSSGSAVICKKTGDLIALHFGFDSAYDWEEAANFAVAGENLDEHITKIIKPVTGITDKSAQTS